MGDPPINKASPRSEDFHAPVHQGCRQVVSEHHTALRHFRIVASPSLDPDHIWAIVSCTYGKPESLTQDLEGKPEPNRKTQSTSFVLVTDSDHLFQTPTTIQQMSPNTVALTTTDCDPQSPELMGLGFSHGTVVRRWLGLESGKS